MRLLWRRVGDDMFGRKRVKLLHAAEELTRRLEEKASLVVDDRLIADLGIKRKALYHIIYDLVRRERMFMLADKNDQMLLMTNTEFNRFMLRRSGRTTPLPALALSETDIKKTGIAGTVYVETEREDDLPVVAEIAAQLAAENRMLTDDMFCDDADSSIFLVPPAEKVLDDYWEIPAAALDSSLASNLSPSIPEPLGSAVSAWGKATTRKTRRSERHDIEPLSAGDALGDLGWFTFDSAQAGNNGPDLPDQRQSLPERKREPWFTVGEAERD